MPSFHHLKIPIRTSLQPFPAKQIHLHWLLNPTVEGQKDPQIALDDLDAAIHAIKKVGDLPSFLFNIDEDDDTRPKNATASSSADFQPENKGFVCMETSAEDDQSPND
jgi:hypothetical protein